MKAIAWLTLFVLVLWGDTGENYRKFIEVNSKPVEIQKPEGMHDIGEVVIPQTVAQEAHQGDASSDDESSVLDDEIAKLLYPKGLDAMGEIKFISNKGQARAEH